MTNKEKIKEMSFAQKIDLIQAVSLVADFWEVKPADLVGFTAMTKPDKKEKWNEIATEVQEFMKMDFRSRAEKLGLKVTLKEETK